MPNAKKRLELDPGQLLAFAGLVRANGVRAAAAALGVPRSTVSRRLQQLEKAVGAPLVVRGSRSFALTDLGRELAARGDALDRLLRESEDVVSQMHEEPTGVLRIDAAPVLADEVLPDVIGEMLARYPRLSIEVRTAVDYIDLRAGSADVVLRARRLEDSDDVYAIHLGTSVTGCYVSPAYAKRRGTPSSPADLTDHDCIVVGSRTPLTWTFAGAAGSIPIHGRVRVESFRLARELAALGAGVLRAASIFAAPLVSSGKLVPILERYWEPTPIYAAHVGKPSPKLRAFLSLVRVQVGRALPTSGEARWRTA